MPEMSLSEAAKWAKVSRPTIFKAITSGRLAGHKNDSGEWRIDPADLERVYGEFRNRKQEGYTPEAIVDSNREIAALMASKDREIALLSDAVNDARKQRDDAQRREEETRALLRDLPRMLTHQPTPTDERTAEMMATDPKAPMHGAGGFRVLGFRITRTRGGK